MQSASVEHDVLHAAAPHTYGLHDEVVAAAHVPKPSQLRVALAVVPEQLAGPHGVDEFGYAPQPVRSEPLHWAWHEPLPPHAARAPTGGPTTGEQNPSFPPTLHASHCPAHGESQQYPSTQLPLPHSAGVVQVAAVDFAQMPLLVALHVRPLAHEAVVQQTPSTQLPAPHSRAPPQVAPYAFLGTHVEALQYVPLTQSVSAAHVALHCVAPHTYGVHADVVAAGQLPTPSQ